MFYTYVILCQRGKYYVGHTHNFELRFFRHRNKSGAKFTSQNEPLKILWSQKFVTELEAVQREKQIKGWSRLKKEKLIKGEWT